MASEDHCIWTRTCPRHSWFLEHLGIRTRLRTTLALHPCFCGSLCFNDLHCQEKKTENAASLTQPKSVSEPKIKAVLDKRGLVWRNSFALAFRFFTCHFSSISSRSQPVTVGHGRYRMVSNDRQHISCCRTLVNRDKLFQCSLHRIIQ